MSGTLQKAGDAWKITPSKYPTAYDVYKVHAGSFRGYFPHRVNANNALTGRITQLMPMCPLFMEFIQNRVVWIHHLMDHREYTHPDDFRTPHTWHTHYPHGYQEMSRTQQKLMSYPGEWDNLHDDIYVFKHFLLGTSLQRTPKPLFWIDLAEHSTRARWRTLNDLREIPDYYVALSKIKP